jgi:hypothetical protein
MNEMKSEDMLYSEAVQKLCDERKKYIKESMDVDMDRPEMIRRK